MESIGWIVIETQFDPTHLHHKETVFTLANGYLGTRGSFDEGYPGACATTFIHGVYDDVPVMHTELVNCPDWLPLVVIVAGQLFRLDQGQILRYERKLDLRLGLLTRRVRWRSPAGHTVDLNFERFTSLADEHVLAQRCQITSVDFEGSIEVQASINGNVDNQGLNHWKWLGQGDLDLGLEQPESPKSKVIWLHTQTHHSALELGMAAQLTVSDLPAEVYVQGAKNYPTLATTFQIQPGQTVTLEKSVTVFTSRDTDAPVYAASHLLTDLPSYTTLLAAHVAAWANMWQDSDILIEGDPKAQLAVRYNLFQLLAVAPRHDTSVSIPAKALSGYAYRGHIFWDTEIFIVPFLAFTQPALARNLLTYRYHTLPGARRKAQEAGYEGALFAWESAGTGDEVTPRWVSGPDGQMVRIWCSDIELHITTDVAYAAWHYWQATGDDVWMRDYGAEIILDTAVFWGSRVEWNADRGCYEISDVIGPDENHERVDNNAFTNGMVQWHLKTAMSVWNWLQGEDGDRAAELEKKLNLTLKRLHQWADISRGLLVAQNAETGLIEQFEGFFDLEYVNMADYEPRTKSMQAILGIEGANQRQVLKQPDVLMLLYLLGSDRQTLQANWDYYTQRTDHSHGSSLGPAINAILACELDKPAEAYNHFMRAALVDLEDVRGNAAEGVHAASAGGIWQAVVFGFGGICLTPEGPVATPHLPPGWTRLKFQLKWRNERYDFDLKQSTIGDRQSIMVSTPTSNPEFPTANIRGAIFDLDGVLTDTADFHYLGWKRFADEEGIPFDWEANEGMRGLTRRDSLLYILDILGNRQFTEAQMQEMMDRKNGYYLELIAGMTSDSLLPGVLPLLKELRAAGIKVAVGSSSKNAQLAIERLGIGGYLDAIADGYSVENPKPAPDLFLYAAELLGIPPEQCVVLEDASAGVEAALAAGMYAVGLGPVERVGRAHVVLPSLEGEDWADLLAKIAHNAQPDAIREHSNV
ncbi:MAG: beta-phosphoglucomutase [Aphanothece sp. CMT-3BRIN-NPC111]|jgi:kojibiose phosphorylase|nr:beta-phosphoglucomutase [Aphanothece sp. CMT-3BRIN-NPC111]